jgi:light-regulated signal transduction histidine kinase (bacteriophytochrome)
VSHGRAKRPRPTWDTLAAAAHRLRSSLNAIHTWAHLLEVHLGPSADPSVRRALDGIHAGVRAQVLLIEDLLEGSKEPPAGMEAGKARRKTARARQR